MLRSTLIRACLIVSVLLCLTAWAVPAPARAQAGGWQPQIAIVWPHDPRGNGVPLEESTLVNVSVWPRGQVECDPRPPLRLWVAEGNEPARLAAMNYQKIFRAILGGVFPTLEFTDILANLRANPAARFTYVLYGELQPTRSDFAGNAWVHAIDARTLLPQPPVPTGLATTPFPEAFDTRIQVVWPHDEAGRFAPVERARLVNVAVEVFAQGTLLAAVPDSGGSYPFSLTLYAAVDNGDWQPMSAAPQLVSYTVNGRSFPRWVFNNIPVDPQRQTHFLVALLPAGGKAVSPYTTIWTHALDARTLLPQPVAPPPCLPSAQAVAPSQAQLAFVRGVRISDDPSPAGGATHLFVANLGSADAIDLTPHTTASYSAPAYSPDGRQIAVLSTHGGGRADYALFVMDANGGNMRQVSTRRYSQTYGPVYWSRDGKRLALYYPGDFTYHIYGLNGGGLQRAAVLPDDEWVWPADAPDGRARVVPCTAKNGRSLVEPLCVQSLGSGARPPNPFDPDNGLGGVAVAWSPDGGRIALQLEGGAEGPGIYVVNADGTGLAALFNGAWPTWQPVPWRARQTAATRSPAGGAWPGGALAARRAAAR